MPEVIRRPVVRKTFNIIRSSAELERLIPDLPDSECYKIISGGNFASISFIRLVGSKTKIKELTASTLRVGKKELQQLDLMAKNGRIASASFVVGNVMKHDSKKGLSYGYYDNFESVCNRNGWSYCVSKNHSKLILMDTESGKFVLETSSNLNENPNIEQFSFENDELLYDFYYEFLQKIVRCGNG